MSTKSPSQMVQESAMQEEAAFRMLPFGVDLFQDAPLRLARAKHLPLNNAQALTREVVEALVASIERGTLAFLSRQGGWKRRMIAEAGRDDPRMNERGIGPHQWRGSNRALRFSDRSIRNVILAYNAVCLASGVKPANSRSKGAYLLELKESMELNGDLLAHHIIWKRLHDANFRVNDVTWQSFQRNPLTMLVELRMERPQDAQAVLDRMLQPDMAPSWPWLTEYIETFWRFKLINRWDSLEKFDRMNKSLAEFGEALFARALEDNRRDYLLVYLEFCRRQFDPEQEYERARLDAFNRISKKLKLADRDAYRHTWARHVSLCARLREEYDEVRHVHPIDREAADKVFMNAYERAPFTEIAHRAHLFSNTLRGVIA